MIIGNVNYSRIWRYMEVMHALPDLRVQDLHFTRVDTFNDAFEGFEGLDSASPITTLPSQEKKSPTGKLNEDSWKDNYFPREGKIRDVKLLSQNYFASCWSMVGPQGMHMWNAFAGKDRDWVALESTFRQLHDALPDSYSTLCIGTVAYFPEPFKALPTGQPVDLLYRKREAFEYEREVRVVVAPSLESKALKLPPGSTETKLRTTQPYITRMICHPRMDQDTRAKIESEVLASGLTFEVIRSTISGTPNC